MKAQDTVIEGTAQEVIAKLAHLPAGERVRVMVGRPSLGLIARRLQATAAANGMTDEIHDGLLRSLAAVGERTAQVLLRNHRFHGIVST